MVSRKLTAVFAVLLMTVTAFAVMSDCGESDASAEKTVELIPMVDADFERSSEKETYYGWGEKSYYYTTETVDDLFIEYINGRDKAFIQETVTPEEGEQYYIYSVGDRIWQGVVFHRDIPTYITADAGIHSITLREDLDWMDVVYGWDKLKLPFAETVSFEMFQGGSVYVMSDVADFEHLQPVTVELGDNLDVPKEFQATGDMDTLSTTLCWFGDTLTVPEGQVNSEAIFMIPAGKSDRFVDEVIEGGLSEFDRSDYGIIPPGPFKEGTYDVFVFRHYLAAPEDVYMFLGDAGDYRVPLIKGHDAGLTTFTKPNTDFTVALEFDESKFSAMVTTGKGVFYLSSGYEYTFQTNYASEVVILLEPISEFDTNVSGEIRYELTGVETESGSPTGLAAVCILMSVLVFAVLFLSNRKPHW